MDKPEFQLYFDVLQAPEKLNVPYVIIGAFAGTSHGVTRTTLDIDIVVDLSETHIQALAADQGVDKCFDVHTIHIFYTRQSLTGTAEAYTIALCCLSISLSQAILA
jgi:hypothetical protein